MRRFFEAFSTTFIVMFAVPTVLIVASWNSLPGSGMYRVKLGLEQALLLVVSPSYATRGALQVKYTERRFAESTRLLADQASIEGLPYLEKQVAVTTSAVRNAPNAQVKKQLAENYLATLKTASVTLEQQKNKISRGSGSVQPVTQNQLQRPPPTLTPRPNIPNPTAISPAVVTTPPAAVVVEEIQNTQDHIDEAIEEIEQIIQNPSIQSNRENEERDRPDKSEKMDKKEDSKSHQENNQGSQGGGNGDDNRDRDRR